MNRHVVTVVLAVSLAGCASRQQSTCCETTPTFMGEPQPVTVIDSVELIKAAFNANADKLRILLLVSPVCSECVFGAQVVRRSIVDRFVASGVYAVVVWEPMIEPDTEAAARRSSANFAGAPAAQFYDPERQTGWAYEREHFSGKWDDVEAALSSDHWLREVVDSKPDPSPEWDIYMLFKPGVRWEEHVPRPDAFIRHIGRDEQGRSRYWRDRFDTPPAMGDLDEAMERMGRDVLRSSQAMNIELPLVPPPSAARNTNQRAIDGVVQPPVSGVSTASRESVMPAIQPSGLNWNTRSVCTRLMTMSMNTVRSGWKSWPSRFVSSRMLPMSSYPNVE